MVKSTPPTDGEPSRANPVLRMGHPAEGRLRWRPLLASAVLHVLLVAVFLVLPGPFLKDEEPEPVEVVFYSPEDLERALELPEPEPAPEEIAELQPVERVVRHQPVKAPEPEPEPRTALPEPARPRPTVRTDLFKTETTPEPTAVVSRQQTRTGSFGEAEPEAIVPARAQPERTVQTAGGFADDVPDDSEAPTGQRNTRVVASGSFPDDAMAVPREGKPARRGGTVTHTTFVSEAADPTVTPRVAGEVSRGGFGAEEAAARPASKRRRTIDVEDPDSPVEIVSKPRPVYTDQARDLRIEGEVVLEVTFVATGQLRVLRIVGSLGHGLDEAAVNAAKKIEFTPARRNGRPVDHTATLRVVFRLA